MTALTIAGDTGVIIADQQPTGGGLMTDTTGQITGQMLLRFAQSVGVVMTVGTGGLLYRRVVHARAGKIQRRMTGVAIDDDRDVIDFLAGRNSAVMTAITVARCAGKDAVKMTGLASGKLVFARQGITGSKVIEVTAYD